MALFLGIDIGGTKIAGGIVSESGVVTGRDTRPTPAQEGGPAILRAALELAQALRTAAPEAVQGIGIGTGGQVNADEGVIVSATELLPGWAGTPVRAAFVEALGLPAVVDNDVNALAVGEGRFGAGRGLATVVVLALGTGVGGALLLRGRLHHGAHWAGGEFGHLLLTMEGRMDTGGNRGTLEAYASGPGLVQTWRELTGSMDDTVSGRAIAAEAARDPHSPAAQAITRTGEYLGYGLVSLANTLDPDVIIIGGGLAALGEDLLGPARRKLQKEALPGPASCPVVRAALGADSSIIGAAALAMPHAS